MTAWKLIITNLEVESLKKKNAADNGQAYTRNKKIEMRKGKNPTDFSVNEMWMISDILTLRFFFFIST